MTQLNLSSNIFRKITEKNNIITFYSHPSKSEHNQNPDEFIKLLDTVLTPVSSKKWIWIIDADGFDLKHALDINSGRQLATLLTEKYVTSLVEIKFINPTWHLRSLITRIWPFMDISLKSKINIISDKPHSILEFM